MTPLDITRLEEMSLNAWPAPKRLVMGGWMLQFANGYTNRANSVHPLHASGDGDVRARIRACERHYADVGLPAKFKITSASQPANLERTLIDAGYRPTRGTSVQTRALHGTSAPDSPASLAWDYRDEAWTTSYRDFAGLSEKDHAMLERILAGIALRTHFAAVNDEAGVTAAVGLAVREGAWVGLFDIMVRPELRGRGFGRRIVQSLLGWAARADVRHAYLQVDQNNTPAVGLYASLGFREAYTYRYFMKG